MNIKRTATKITTFFCIAGVVLAGNAPAVSAYEAHVVNVTATIIDNRVVISPEGGKFCDDGKLEVELKSKMEGAKVYYTTSGSEPKCGSGKEYVGAFAIAGSTTVKAVSCYNGKQGPVETRSFDLGASYCQTSLKINEVYYYADVDHGGTSSDNENEWFEIYNPTKENVNLNGWSACNAESCDELADRDLFIPAKGYAVVAYKGNTWSYWNIPESAVKINLSSVIGSGLGNTADMLLIKNAAGDIVDQMNWGGADSRWNNYNAQVWGRGVAAATGGEILGRTSNGYDTDSVSDWKAYDLPSVAVLYPNGGEDWVVGNTYTIAWKASNPNGSGSDLGIDIYYSADSGKTWASIVKNTANDGAFEWRLPMIITDSGTIYFTDTDKARIKVVATDYGRNFMLTGKDVSDRDFCPPIDKSLLNAQELKLLSEMDTTGMLFVDAKTAAADDTRSGAHSANDANKNSSEIKQSNMLNREEDEFSIEGQSDDSEKDASDKKETGAQETDNKTPKIEIVKTLAVKTDSARASAKTAAGAADSAGKKTSLASDDMPILPDTDTVIEFNLNA